MWLADHMHAAPHAERSCVKGRPESVDGVPRAGGWSHRPPWSGLSRYLPTILLFARSVFFLSRYLSRQCLGVNILFSGGRRRRRYV